VSTDEVVEALNFMQRSAMFHLAYGLMDCGWQWVTPSQELLSKVVDEGRAWWWGWGSAHDGLLVARRTRRDEESRLRVENLICDLEALDDCLRELRSFAGEWGVEQVRWMAPLDPSLAAILEGAGYQRGRDHTILIFEKDHTGSGNSPTMV
jgi:hypothetical protein